MKVLSDEETDEILEKGVDFDHKPESIAEIHRQIQRDADFEYHEKVKAEMIKELEKYHTDAPFHNFSVYLTEEEWQSFKQKYGGK